MRAVVVTLLLTLSACPHPAQKAEKTKPAPSAEPKGKATAAPSAEAPLDEGPVYDPAQDPRNSGGWDFSERRDPAAPADAKKTPFDIEALYKLVILSDPQWSPDGKQLLFVAARTRLAEGKSNRDVYLVNADGSGLRRMTRHEGNDSHPRWAPDGASFLFVSSREQGSQVWRMPADGGEAEQLTHVSTGVSGPSWSPDGKRIAFSSRVYPEHGADDAKNKAAMDDAKSSPIQAHLADELLYRHWSFYKDGRRNHVLLLDVDSGEVSDLTPGEFDTPAFELGGGDIAFSPDSAEVCLVSNREEGDARAWTTNKDLWTVPVNGGEAVNLTKANKAYDGHPAYSPDGRHIAYLRQVTPGHESDRLRLSLYDRKTGKVRVLTEGFDNWVVDYRWAADSKTIVFRGAEKGRFPLYRLDVTSGTIARLHLPLARAFDVSSQDKVAFVYTQVDQPTELFVADGRGQHAKRLTHFNAKISKKHDIRPVEEMWIEGAAGKKIHTFVVKPHGYKPNKKYPLIINVHGGPQYQWSDMFRGDWQVYPGAGYVVAFFNPHGSIGYGQAFTSAISKDWGGKVYEDVIKVTEVLSKLDYVDDKKVGAMGWSYGGYMMNWILGHTDRFAALVSMMGVYDLQSMYGATEEIWFPEWDVGGNPWQNAAVFRKWSPSTYAGTFKTPTLVITGEKDYRVPYTQSLQLFTALRRQKVPARLIVFPNDGHWPSYVRSMPLYYAAHLDWFSRYLGGGKSPWDIKAMVRGRAFK